MVQIAEEPLTKVTLNLNTSDVEWLKGYYGHGYTTEVRRIVRRFVRARELLRKGHPDVE